MKGASWRTVHPRINFATEAALRLTLLGGQCFRWTEFAPRVYQGHWAECGATVRRGNDGALEYSPPATNAPESRIAAYFAAETDFAALDDRLPWRSDPVLARARGFARGLRLLRQPVGEALLCYLCSSTKRIEQIRQITDSLAKTLGPAAFVLPTWKTLASVPEADLRALGLGYRARYVHETAIRLADSPNWEPALSQQSYPEARAWLMRLPGVGPKIADCVCLFGLGLYESFPVDTWILQAMGKHYGLGKWHPDQITCFARVHFGSAAGLAQQYLFEAIRLGGLRKPNSASR